MYAVLRKLGCSSSSSSSGCSLSAFSSSCQKCVHHLATRLPLPLTLSDAVLLQRRSLPPVAGFAEPELKLAGLRMQIDPDYNAGSRMLSKLLASKLLPSHSETLAPPSLVFRIDIISKPYLWNSLHKPRLNRGYSTSLRRYEFHSKPPLVRGFSSQADVAAKEGMRRAKLTWESQSAGKKKSEAMLMYLVAMVTAMVGATYAAVPLYRKFCQATGYGGTVQRRETVEEKIARHQTEESAAENRELVVQFNADVADGMPWKFTPCQREIRVRPGQSTLAFYTAENTSSTPITGVSTYNVTPMKAGLYFNKIQCFCFEEQRLLPGEKIDMPVFFFIDPEFATDPKMDAINSLILSYTFFKVEEAPPPA